MTNEVLDKRFRLFLQKESIRKMAAALATSQIEREAVYDLVLAAFTAGAVAGAELTMAEIKTLATETKQDDQIH